MKSVEEVVCLRLVKKISKAFHWYSKKAKFFHNSKTAYETFLKKNLHKWFKERKHCWNKRTTSLDGHCERQPAFETKFEKC